MLRTKRILESGTAATVVPTTRDGATFRIQDSDVLPHSRGHAVLTNPPYRIDNAAVATNFRWYLSNSIYQQRRQAGAEPGQVIFISIHADSLHPSLNGAMVYIPGLVGITNNYGKSGSVYNARREVRAQPRVSFTRTERTTSKGLIPAKVLLEVCNLSNDQDRRLIKTRAYRQRVAEAIVNGILSYYGVPGTRVDRSVTAGS